MAGAMMVNAGCYAYVPAPAGAPLAAGGLVKVRLTADGTTNLAQFLGPRVEYADGMLSEVGSDGSIVVGVTSVRLLDGIDQHWSGRSVVTFPAQYVAEVQARTIDKGRTRIAVAATVLALATIVGLAFGVTAARGDGGADGGGPTP